MQSRCRNEWKVQRTKRGDGMGIRFERRQGASGGAFSLVGSRLGGRFAAPTLTGELQIGWVTKDFQVRAVQRFFCQHRVNTHHSY